jgi:hypothetical protein
MFAAPILVKRKKKIASLQAQEERTGFDLGTSSVERSR